MSRSGSSREWSISKEATITAEIQIRHNGLLIDNDNYQQVRIETHPQTAPVKTK